MPGLVAPGDMSVLPGTFAPGVSDPPGGDRLPGALSGSSSWRRMQSSRTLAFTMPEQAISASSRGLPSVDDGAALAGTGVVAAGSGSTAGGTGCAGCTGCTGRPTGGVGRVPTAPVSVPVPVEVWAAAMPAPAASQVRIVKLRKVEAMALPFARDAECGSHPGSGKPHALSATGATRVARATPSGAASVTFRLSEPHTMGPSSFVRPARSACRASQLPVLAAAAWLAACGGGGGGGAAPPAPQPAVVTSCAAVVASALPAPDAPVTAPPVDGPAWTGFAGNAQHTALGGVASQALSGIFWSTPVDLAPQYTSSGGLLVHYGSPVITRANTVIVPVKTGASGGFRIEARGGASGNLKWALNSDYRLPPFNWLPSFNPALAGSRVAMPAAGGRVLLRDTPDAASGSVSTVAFYGNGSYAAQPSTYDATVCINTPITADAAGNLWFGFVVGGPNPAGLASGIARVGADGSGRWVAASVAADNAALVKPQTNAAPALSNDGSTVYVVVNTVPPSGGRATGALLALDSTTLATRARRTLLDPVTGTPAWVSDNASASPMVAPDGEVFIGVLEANAPAHNAAAGCCTTTAA